VGVEALACTCIHFVSLSSAGQTDAYEVQNVKVQNQQSVA